MLLGCLIVFYHSVANLIADERKLRLVAEHSNNVARMARLGDRVSHLRQSIDFSMNNESEIV